MHDFSDTDAMNIFPESPRIEPNEHSEKLRKLLEANTLEVHSGMLSTIDHVSRAGEGWPNLGLNVGRHVRYYDMKK